VNRLRGALAALRHYQPSRSLIRMYSSEALNCLRGAVGAAP
jgi:hypothetical protein